MLGIEQKKGDSHNLCGRLIVYAKISPSASKNDSGPIPFTSMVKNGILAVKGEFKNNDSLKRFMQHEMGSSMDKGISDLIEHIKEQGGELPEESMRMPSATGLKSFPVWKSSLYRQKSFFTKAKRKF